MTNAFAKNPSIRCFIMICGGLYDEGKRPQRYSDFVNKKDTLTSQQNYS
jgi:hypothetical protein